MKRMIETKEIDPKPLMRASMMMRKFGIKFSSHHPDPAAVKDAFIKVKSMSDWHGVLEMYYASIPGL